jgi:hypothetical protein
LATNVSPLSLLRFRRGCCNSSDARGRLFARSELRALWIDASGENMAAGMQAEEFAMERAVLVLSAQSWLSQECVAETLHWSSGTRTELAKQVRSLHLPTRIPLASSRTAWKNRKERLKEHDTLLPPSICTTAHVKHFFFAYIVPRSYQPYITDTHHDNTNVNSMHTVINAADKTCWEAEQVQYCIVMSLLIIVTDSCHSRKIAATRALP